MSREICCQFCLHLPPTPPPPLLPSPRAPTCGTLHQAACQMRLTGYLYKIYIIIIYIFFDTCPSVCRALSSARAAARFVSLLRSSSTAAALPGQPEESAWCCLHTIISAGCASKVTDIQIPADSHFPQRKRHACIMQVSPPSRRKCQDAYTSSSLYFTMSIQLQSPAFCCESTTGVMSALTSTSTKSGASGMQWLAHGLRDTCCMTCSFADMLTASCMRSPAQRGSAGHSRLPGQIT